MENEDFRDTTHEEIKEQPKKKRFALSKGTYYALLGILVAVIVLCAVYLGGYFWETKTAQDGYDELDSLREQNLPQRPTGVTPGPNVGTDTGNPQKPTILPELQPIYEKNNDLVGWLDFPYDDLPISYPVMQTPYDEQFYLHHQFNREPNGNVAVGCPYVPLSCDVFEPSDNVIIYGHNLSSGGMFNRLTYYRDKSFWENHQTFYFDTLYERHTYRVFAVFRTAATQYKADGSVYGYPYHRLNDFANQEEFDKFVADVKGEAFTSGGYRGSTYYDTGIRPQYGDKLLCLSTCEYTLGEPRDPGSRLVVVAVRID